MTPEALLERARRPLCLGIGGGGDVVGALAVAEGFRRRSRAAPVVGGVSWERRPVDPEPGPRSEAEIEGARPLGTGVLLAGPQTRVRGREVRFAEARVAELLGRPTLLVDANRAPREIAAGLLAAGEALGCDLIVFIDVGGDVLGTGAEPGLASPLCDAMLIASAAHLHRSARAAVLGAVFGAGCDGELTLAEVAARLGVLDRAGALGPAWTLGEAELERLDAAVASVPTEASAMALRAARGELGEVAIRDGRRSVTLDPLAGRIVFFDPVLALDSATPLAAAVMDANGLEQANLLLHSRGVRTELDYERRLAGRA